MKASKPRVFDSLFYKLNQGKMLISCTICQELIGATQTAMVTNCGHCYHQECIHRWAEYRVTCPQCRVYLIPKPIRVFFSFEDVEDDANPNAELLQFNIAQLRSQHDDLQNRNLEVMNQVGTLEAEKKTYLERIISLEKALTDKDRVINSSRTKITILLSDNKQLRDVAGKLDKANKDLHLLRSVHKILYGTQQDVEKAVENMTYPESIRQLCTYVEVLKKQSEKNSLRYKMLLKNHKRLEKELRLAPQSVQENRWDEQQSSEPIEEITNTFKSLNHTAAGVVKNSLSKDLSLKVMNNLKIKRLDEASNPRLRMLPSNKMLLACQSRGSSCRSHFGYGAMGGSKRISLVKPKPPEELAHGRKQVLNKLSSKLGDRAPNLTVQTNQNRAPDTTCDSAMDSC